MQPVQASLMIVALLLTPSRVWSAPSNGDRFCQQLLAGTNSEILGSFSSGLIVNFSDSESELLRQMILADFRADYVSRAARMEHNAVELASAYIHHGGDPNDLFIQLGPIDHWPRLTSSDFFQKVQIELNMKGKSGADLGSLGFINGVRHFSTAEQAKFAALANHPDIVRGLLHKLIQDGAYSQALNVMIYTNIVQGEERARILIKIADNWTDTFNASPKPNLNLVGEAIHALSLVDTPKFRRQAARRLLTIGADLFARGLNGSEPRPNQDNQNEFIQFQDQTIVKKLKPDEIDQIPDLTGQDFHPHHLISLGMYATRMSGDIEAMAEANVYSMYEPVTKVTSKQSAVQLAGQIDKRLRVLWANDEFAFDDISDAIFSLRTNEAAEELNKLTTKWIVLVKKKLDLAKARKGSDPREQMALESYLEFYFHLLVASEKTNEATALFWSVVRGEFVPDHHRHYEGGLVYEMLTFLPNKKQVLAQLLKFLEAKSPIYSTFLNKSLDQDQHATLFRTSRRPRTAVLDLKMRNLVRLNTNISSTLALADQYQKENRPRTNRATEFEPGTYFGILSSGDGEGMIARAKALAKDRSLATPSDPSSYFMALLGLLLRAPTK